MDDVAQSLGLDIEQINWRLEPYDYFEAVDFYWE